MTYRALRNAFRAHIQPHKVRQLSGRGSLRDGWAQARIIAGLLAVCVVAACGGGSGGVTNVQQQPQPQPPQLSALLSPGTLPFGSLQLGYTSSTQTANLVNSGGGAINITAINISGDFAQTNNCPSSLAIGAGCVFNLSFTPTANGLRTGTLSVITSASTTAQTISLFGTGITISTGVSLGNLTFNNQSPGTTSGGQTDTLTNTGSVPITVAISTTGAFSETDNCAGGVNVGGNCMITVTFTPAAPGPSNGTLTVTITSNGATGPPQVVTLTGTGTAAMVSFSASPLDFVNQPINTTSSAQTETVTNTGSAGLTITSVAISGVNAGDFTKGADSCTGATVAPNNTCTVKVTFTPSATGNRSASLSFTDNASGSPQAVTLGGTGTQPLVGFSAPSLNFPSEPVGTMSSAMTETVTNTGAANLSISSVAVGGVDPGDFAKSSDTCTGASVAPNNTCTVHVTFTPTATGGRGATLSFTDSAPFSPQTVALTGTGTEPAVGFSTSPLNFNGQPINTTSSALTETVTNNGTGNLGISLVAISGTNASDFSKGTDTCTGASVISGGSCKVSVTFTPSSTGSRSASLNFTDNGPGSSQSIPMIGTGTQSMVGLSSASLNFTQIEKTASPAMTETVTNKGSATLAISDVVIGGTNVSDFSKTADTCSGAKLTTSGASSTCKVSVTFTPSTTGTFSALLEIVDNAPGGTQDVPLNGTGTQSSVELSATTLTFPGQLINTTGTGMTETITDTGSGNLIVSSVGIGGTNPGDFAMVTDTCSGATVAPSKTCKVFVKFTPSAAGPRSATLSFNDNASSSPQEVDLDGTGTAPTVSLSTPDLAFPNQLTSTTSAALTETVTNTGTGNLIIATAAIGGTNAGNFNKTSDTCTGATLTISGASSACKVSVTFTPNSTQGYSASLVFTDNAIGSPQTAPLSGVGTDSTASPSAPTLTFPAQSTGTTSTFQPETITNLGTENLMISAVTLSGTDPAEFAKSSDGCTGATVLPNKTCTVDVTFTPAAPGIRTATLNFTDNATASPQMVNLTGLGMGPLAGVYTQRYDNGRTGQNTVETYLNTSNVTEEACGAHPRCFGKLLALPVDGAVYAQPLYMENVTIPNQGAHNVVIVATQHDSVYAFDADGQSTAPLWHVNFLNASTPVTTVPCTDVYGNGSGACDISPEIGITSTPVIDSVGGTIYLTAKTREPVGTSPNCTENPAGTGSGSYDYCYRLHALDITTGAEKFSGPKLITASAAGTGYDNVSGVVTFSSFREMQRPGLLLLNGTLYIGFGSHGDNDDYHGWLMAYNPTTLAQITAFCTTPNGMRGAIWQGGGGIAADTSSPPNLFIAIANGTFDGNNSGGQDWGDSVLRMQLVSGQFQVMDYFTPIDQAILDANDLDLGSSPPLLLPTQSGTYPNLLAVGGKDGRLWMLNRSNLGTYQTNDTGAVQVIPEIGSDALFGGGAYWNGNLYFQEVGGDLNQFTVESNGTMGTPPTSSTYEGGYPNAIPVISSNGTSNGVLWWVGTSNFGHNGPAELHALNATDVGMDEIYESNQAPGNRDQAGPAVKFAVPTIANGKVYVGAVGEVDIYSLLP